MNDYQGGPDRRAGRDQKIQDLHEDITEHVETERLLRADVANKDVLLQEISHRVLNGFHLVSGMLQVQARKSNDLEVRHQLEIAAHRVLSLALVHRRLYESAIDIKVVNAKKYLTGLCKELRDGFFSNDDNRNLSLDAVEDIEMSTEMMAIVGLLVSELVTNACKYAYGPKEQGTVAVSLIHCDDKYCLTVGDTGAGLPQGFDVDKSKGLGMSIVKAQVRGIGGVLEIENETPGTRFIVHIPASPAD